MQQGSALLNWALTHARVLRTLTACLNTHADGACVPERKLSVRHVRMMSRCMLLAWLGVACATEPSAEALSRDNSVDQASLAHRKKDHKSIRFAVIGDYGIDSEGERDVAALVHRMNPDFIVTTGDNNYPKGAAHQLDVNIGQYYHDFMFPYHGVFGQGAHRNRFWPALGNHDWEAGDLSPYLQYFNLPGNGRYYDVAQGPVHLFALDTDAREPDGITADSIQGRWLQAALASSQAPWKIVYMHHPPFASAKKPMPKEVDWPYAAWGASLVISGHKHFYERLEHDGIPYIINGLAGAEIAKFGKSHDDSIVRFNDDFGAMRAEASETKLKFEFVTRAGDVIDKFSL